MVDYSKTKIYRIPVGNENYYGHTTQPLCKRKKSHKSDFTKEPNRKIYKAMREANMTADDIELILVEDYPCKSMEQAKARERYYIENFGTLNATVPFKEGMTIKEYNREYRANNRDSRSAYLREYRANNRDEVRAKHREYLREYRANNREEYNAKHREYMRKYRSKKIENYI